LVETKKIETVMVVGHFAAAMLGKSIAREIPLWHLLIAANLADFLWIFFNIIHIEDFAIKMAGISEYSSKMLGLDLFNMPWSHGLVPVLVWSTVAALIYRHLTPIKSPSVPIVVGMVCLSHWWLDLIVHRPDLPITVGGARFGFGFWSSAIASLVIELLLLALACFCYIRRTRLLPKKLWQGDENWAQAVRWRFATFVGVMVIVQLFVTFVNPIAIRSFFMIAFFALMLFVTWLGYWADNIRGAVSKGLSYREFQVIPKFLQ
jgi:hypothetical protein